MKISLYQTVVILQLYLLFVNGANLFLSLEENIYGTKHTKEKTI